MKSKLMKKMLIPIIAGVAIGILWQVFVLNLLEYGVIKSFTALVLLCFLYAVIGGGALALIRMVHSRLKLVVREEGIKELEGKEKEKLERLQDRNDEIGEAVS